MMAVQPIVRAETNTKVTLEVECVMCHKPKVFTVDKWGWNQRLKGELIQVCFPRLDHTIRELMVSGTCGKCWDEMFGKEPD
jgi:hypothetical protein